MQAITESGYSALYRAADHSATIGQRRLLLATVFRLAALATAAVLGSFSFIVESVDAAAIGAGTALGIALVTEVYLLTTRPDRLWQEARTAAESAKTLMWRYLVGGQPFGRDGRDDRVIERLLLERYAKIVSDIHFIAVPPLDDATQVTDTMRRIRALPLDERKRHYAASRINEQRAWYTTKAMLNERRATQWSVSLAGLEALGLTAAVLNGAQLINVDIPGIVGGLAAAGVAWLQTRQHYQLATTYSLTALELGAIAIQVDWPYTESEWAHFVDEAEETISRERMLWAASRG